MARPEIDRLEAELHYTLSGGNVSRASKLSGIPRETIRDWAAHDGWSERLDRLRTRFRELYEVEVVKAQSQSLDETRIAKHVVLQVIADCLDDDGTVKRDAQGHLLFRVAPKSLEGLVAAFVQLSKHERLIVGEATERSESVHADEDQVAERLRRFQEFQRERYAPDRPAH